MSETIKSLQEELAAIKEESAAKDAELAALREAKTELEPENKVVIPEKLDFTVDKKKYRFAKVGAFYWGGQKVLTSDALKNEKMLTAMVTANFILIKEIPS